MAERPSDKTPRGALRALSDWLRGTPPPTPARGTAAPGAMPVRIAHYAITGKLGEGGMGVVYSAHDEKLERTVALKTMSALSGDETARQRFWREARAAASVNHPNVCQLYEIGEDAGELFIAMEMLQGEALSERLKRGVLGLSEAVPVGLGVLAALDALHARGIVHRDLKPSNVFLTPHGVKLLDFGLARPADPVPTHALSPAPDLTRTGVVVGTPRYMAPEQVTGDGLDARSDLFAAGALFFEMLAGRPAFAGRNVVEILHATLYEQPPALTGSPAVAAVDRVIRKALAKNPGERPASAQAMAEELKAVTGLDGDAAPTLARALTRLIVLPFHILRPDPETDFLAYSLADAIATSLSRIGSLVVRSSATAAKFAGPHPDLKAVAAETDVERVVLGTLLRSGDQVRLAVQLVEAPGGTLVTSHTLQASLGDLFQLQDDIARRVVEALSLPLGGDTTPTPDAPRDPRAYRYYLEANELARSYDGLVQARTLYERCLELDSRFAPAWARLGRCHRVVGKYVDGAPDSGAKAENALRRALDINPRLSLAHKYYAQLEGDSGRALPALSRLLAEAARHGNDPELFAGLVHICRYCGLYDEAVAAHYEARRLDPNVPTSLDQTLLMRGEFDRLLGGAQAGAGSGDQGIRVIALGLSGRLDEAKEGLAGMREASRLPAFRAWIAYLRAWLERRRDDMIGSLDHLGGLQIMDDPEAIFQEGWLLCDAGAHEKGLEQLRRAVDKGYTVSPTLQAARAFDPLRNEAAFTALVEEAEAGRRKAFGVFREAGGTKLIGLYANAEPA